MSRACARLETDGERVFSVSAWSNPDKLVPLNRTAARAQRTVHVTGVRASSSEGA
jgi:hypothetical protein